MKILLIEEGLDVVFYNYRAVIQDKEDKLSIDVLYSNNKLTWRLTATNDGLVHPFFQNKGRFAGQILNNTWGLYDPKGFRFIKQTKSFKSKDVFLEYIKLQLRNLLGFDITIEVSPKIKNSIHGIMYTSEITALSINITFSLGLNLPVYAIYDHLSETVKIFMESIVIKGQVILDPKYYSEAVFGMIRNAYWGDDYTPNKEYKTLTLNCGHQNDAKSIMDYILTRPKPTLKQ